MPSLISCQHERRHANDVNHVAFSTVCGFSETSSAIFYLIKLRFHIVASGAHAARVRSPALGFGGTTQLLQRACGCPVANLLHVRDLSNRFKCD